MNKNLKSKELTHIERLRLASPRLAGERPGAYDRRLRANEKAQKSFEALKMKALKVKKVVAPKNFFGKIIEKVFVEPFQFVENMINKFVAVLNAQTYQEGKMTVWFPSSEDEKAGTNPFFVLKDNNGIIVLFAKVVMQKKFIACIKWKGSKADKAKRGIDMLALMANVAFVTVPSATITATRTLVLSYGNSTPGTEEATFTAMNNAFIGIMALYQTYANAFPGTAEDGIKSGGYDVKNITARGPQPWSATQNVVSGTIDLTAAGAGGRGCHEWWISYNGATFVRLEPTMLAHTQVTGLAYGITVYFQHRPITAEGPGTMDLTIKITVQ